jgi:zinc transporter ZupT
MNTLLIAISAGIAFTVTLSAGIFTKKFKTNIGIVCALSAGFFIARSSFDLLPEILKLAPEAQIPIEELLISGIVGFVFLFVLEHVFQCFTLIITQ